MEAGEVKVNEFTVQRIRTPTTGVELSRNRERIIEFARVQRSRYARVRTEIIVIVDSRDWPAAASR